MLWLEQVEQELLLVELMVSQVLINLQFPLIMVEILHSRVLLLLAVEVEVVLFGLILREQVEVQEVQEEELQVIIQQMALELELEQVVKDIREVMQEEVTTPVEVEVQEVLELVVLQFLMEALEFNILLLAHIIGLVVVVELAIQLLEVMVE
jgi:hypothetical protein